MSQSTKEGQQRVATAPVSWDAVRALAMVVGVREAARRMGLSEDQVRQRSSREKWLATDEARAVNKLAVAQRSGITCHHTSPAALIQAELASLGQKSRLSLARGIAKAGEHVETLSGDDILNRSGDVKAIAQTADLVHGWKDAAPQVKIRLDVLNGSAEAVPLDVEATVEAVILSDSEDSDSDWY